MKFYMVNNVTFAELHAKFEQPSSPRGRDIGSQSLTIGIKWLKMTVFFYIFASKPHSQVVLWVETRHAHPTRSYLSLTRKILMM